MVHRVEPTMTPGPRLEKPRDTRAVPQLRQLVLFFLVELAEGNQLEMG